MKNRGKNKSFLAGAAILGVAGLICKVIGAVYRIPLSNYILHKEGIAYYQVAATVRDEATLTRELASLKKINDQYPKYILTLDDDPTADYDGIQRINVLEWLLAPTGA